MADQPAFLSVYVTAASRDEADKIAHAAVEEKLAACATILPGAQSLYRWQGKLENAEECVLILKTDAVHWEALRARIVALHSYECPCIVAWPIVVGHAPYLEWLGNSLAS